MIEHERISPVTGAIMHRDVRPITLTYKEESITVDMPGWYSDQPDDSIHNSKDMDVSDAALEILKARAALAS